MEKENKMLKGGVEYEKEAPERKIYIANLMYKYPEDTETIEIIPAETIVYYNNPKQMNGIGETGRIRDLREEQEIKARGARLQRSNAPEKPARERIDYINKVGNVRDFGVPQVNENVVMKAKKQVKPEKNYEEIANLFYPSMEEKSQIQVKKKPILLGDAETVKEEVLPISDVENTLFKGGMIGSRPLEKIQPVAKNRKQDKNYEEIANLLYPSMREEKYHWDKNGNIIYDTLQVPLPWGERIKRNIQALGDNVYSWLHNSDPNSEAYKQKANLALGVATVPIGGGTVLTGNIAKIATPFLGKKIG